MTLAKDWAGHRFGRLIAVEIAARNPIKWRCQCDCGNESTVEAGALTKGHTKSCGCLWKEQLGKNGLKHGQCNTGAWNTWRDMVKRCGNPNSSNYKHYGGRGIAVCERWLKFENFYADMGDRPNGMSLERKQVEDGYHPGNCEWIPAKRQPLNTRRTVRVRLNGEEMALSEACKKLGLSYNRVRDRIKTLGWTFERAISEPKKVNGTIYAEV